MEPITVVARHKKTGSILYCSNTSKKRKSSSILEWVSAAAALLDLVMWGYSTSFLQTDGSGGGVCGGGGITGFESTLQKLRGCITLSADADEGAPDWLIECATASSKGVVSTLHQCTTTASQLLERRRNCTYTQRERESHRFSSDIRPPCLLLFSLMVVVLVYLFPPPLRGFLCEEKEGLPCLCMSFTVSEREMKTFPQRFSPIGHFTIHRFFEPGLFSSQKWKFHPGFSILFDA